MLTVPYTHPDAAPLTVASYIMDNKTLHSLVREQGGAYGGGSSCQPLSGTFQFFAYRDPNLSKTLDAFKTAVDAIEAGKFEELDIEEAKLEMIQKMDSPLSPGVRAMTTYCQEREGRPNEIRQVFRDRVVVIPPEGEPRGFVPQTPTRLVAYDSPDLVLAAEGTKGPFAKAVVQIRGAPVGTYDRVD